MTAPSWLWLKSANAKTEEKAKQVERLKGSIKESLGVEDITDNEAKRWLDALHEKAAEVYRARGISKFNYEQESERQYRFGHNLETQLRKLNEGSSGAD